MCFMQRAREELCQENSFLTTNATQFGRGKLVRSIGRYRDTRNVLSDGKAHGDAWILQVDWIPESLYL